LEYEKRVEIKNGGNVEVSQNAGIRFNDGFKLDDGAVTMAGLFEVTGDFELTAGTFTVTNPSNLTTSVDVAAYAGGGGGDFTVSGGTASLTLAGISVDDDFLISGGTYKHLGTGTLNLLTAQSVTVGAYGTFTVLGGLKVYADEFVNAGTLDLESDSENPTIGALNLYDLSGGNSGDFTQTSNARMNLRLSGTGTSILDVHGAADISGKAYVYCASSYSPPFYQDSWLINADTMAGGPPSGFWDFSNCPSSYHWTTGTTTSGGRTHWWVRRTYF
jgi:hypothetical protein